jgi:hypothetical protein
MEIFKLKKNQVIKIIPFNREINNRPALAKSLNKYGLINPIKVILTSAFSGKNELYVIDGQHTYNECKRENIDVYYMIVLESDDIPEIVNLMGILNNTQEGWVCDNYIKCYTYVQNPHYLYLVAKKKDTRFSYPVLNTIYGTGRSTKSLKNGSFQIIDKEKGDLICDYVMAINKIKVLSMKAVIGFKNFYDALNNYNHERFLRNLSNHITVLDDCIEIIQFSEKFVTIYNRAK